MFEIFYDLYCPLYYLEVEEAIKIWSDCNLGNTENLLDRSIDFCRERGIRFNNFDIIGFVYSEIVKSSERIFIKHKLLNNIDEYFEIHYRYMSSGIICRCNDSVLLLLKRYYRMTNNKYIKGDIKEVIQKILESKYTHKEIINFLRLLIIKPEQI